MPLEMQRVDIHEVLRDALANVRAELETRQLDLETEFSAPQSIVLGDPVRLQQVLWNLLKNAVKFTSDGGWIHVTTDSTSKPGSVLIEVSDNGLGMSPDEINRVFEAFMQGEHASTSGSHRFGGLGLGLAISHRPRRAALRPDFRGQRRPQPRVGVPGRAAARGRAGGRSYNAARESGGDWPYLGHQHQYPARRGSRLNPRGHPEAAAST
jgi:anti-sigma regulatory factor (Ser/Thr protein kinase)